LGLQTCESYFPCHSAYFPFLRVHISPPFKHHTYICAKKEHFFPYVVFTKTRLKLSDRKESDARSLREEGGQLGNLNLNIWFSLLRKK
jgi:hypothetical protein